MTRIATRAMFVLLAMGLAGCSEEPPPAQQAAAPPAVATPPAPPEPATPPLRPVTVAAAAPMMASHLRGVLPTRSLAYLRIPGVFGILGAPKGVMYDRALESAPWTRTIEGIRDGFGTNVMPEVPPEARSLLSLLVVHARSPVEAVVVPAGSPNAPFPDLLVTVALDFPDAGTFGAFLDEAAKRFPMVQPLAPLDADGNGMLAVGGVPLPMRFRDSRLWLLATAAPDPSTLAGIVDGLVGAPAHPMTSVENRIDASGEGLFAWIDAPRVLESMQAMGRVDEAAMLMALGGGEIRTIALGAGASGGIHRVKLSIEMPHVGFRSFVPEIRSSVGVEAAGVPTAVVVIGLPGPEDLATLEQGLAAVLGPADLSKYLEAKRTLAEALGFGIEDLVDAIGQDFVALFDEAGQYVAVRVRDAAKLETLIARAVERAGVTHEQREIHGETFHHMVVPAFFDPGAADDGADSEISPLQRRLIAMPSHVYWVHEGDYLLASSTPQSLIDRRYVEARTPIAEWLAGEQRLDPQGALLLATLRNEGVPTLLHEMNLQALTSLGDFTGYPVDLFAFPTARELELPDAASYGLRVASTESELSVELAYENNPLEFVLGGGGYTGVAVVGILAAVAIPAYQDYTVRAKVQGGAAAAGPARDYVEQFIRENGRLPRAEEIAGLDLASLGGAEHSVAIHPDGRVSVTYSIAALGDATTLHFVPQVVEGRLRWQCESEFAAKFLPAECRR